MAAPANAASTAPAPARYVARVAAAQPVRFTLHVPLRNRAELETLIRAQSDPASPLYRRFLTPGQFRTRYGIAAATLARLRTVFGGFGLRVVDAGSQDVTLEDPAANVERVLGTELWLVASDGAGWQAAARDPITLPAAVADSAVVGLDATIIRHTHSAEIRPSAADIANARLRGAVLPHNEFSPLGGYLTSDIKQAYRYPSLLSLSGRGAIVGILMDGASNATDVAAYFSAMHLPAPAITLRTVTAAKTGPVTSDPLETTLDIEQIGGIAPDATILDYDVRNLDDDSIYQGLKAIVEDDRAAIVDLPFGACEQYYNGRYTAYLGAEAVPKTLFAQDDLLAQGTVQGQSFVASSGDAGAVACLKPSGFLSYPNADLHPIPGVEYPASDPHVVAVGGTKLVTSYAAGSTASTYVGENAEEDHLVSGGIPSYFGSGGGPSQFFDLPAYQKEFGLHSPGRLVPDVAGHMGGCPSSGWVCGPDASSDIEYFKGEFIDVIGTSAAASDLTGLLALDAQAHAGRHGLVDTDLYALAAKNGSGMTYFHSDVPGFNGYRAAPRYDEITGLGSVIGVFFIGSPLRPVAGNPGTASNPGPSPTVGGTKLAYQSATYTYLGTNAVDLTKAPAAPSAARRPVNPLAPRAATASFDACGGNGCKMAASNNFVLTVNDSSLSIFDRFGNRAPAYPKAIASLLGPSRLKANGISCPSGDCPQAFFTWGAQFDANEQRFIVFTTEWDFDNLAPASATANWISISDGPDPRAGWHSYQYNFDDGDSDSALIFRSALAVTPSTFFISGEMYYANLGPGIRTFGSFGNSEYEYGLAIDRVALEAGKPATAFGFRHVQIDGTEVGGLTPVQPRAASDSPAGRGYYVSLVDDASHCLLYCSTAYLWTLQNPGPAQRLSFLSVPVAPFGAVPGGTSAVNAMNANFVFATSALANGNIAFTFETGGVNAQGAATDVRWERLAVGAGAGGATLGKEIGHGDIVAPPGRIVDLGIPIVNANGTTFVSYVTEAGTVPSTINEIAIAPNGKPGAPQTLYQSSGILNYENTLKPVPASAATVGSEVFFLQPYATATSQSYRVVSSS